MQLGNGIKRQSARPLKIHVDQNTGEVWFCDRPLKTGETYEGAGCSPQSANPQND